MKAFNWQSIAALNNPNFRLRLISALVMLPVTLAVVMVGGWIYIAGVIIAAAIGLHEWLRMLDADASRTTRILCYFFAVDIALAAIFLGGAFVLLPVLCAVLAVAIAMKRKHHFWRTLVALISGVLYMGSFAAAMVTLGGSLEYSNAKPVLFLLFVVWATDVGAYLTGRVVGGPKLAPSISPNKTWSGLLGGMAAAAAVAYAFPYPYQESHMAMNVSFSAMILAVISQMGDLFESAVKRRCGVKDSGTLIPGHGGILDRIDGLIFAAVFMVAVQFVQPSLFDHILK